MTFAALRKLILDIEKKSSGVIPGQAASSQQSPQPWAFGLKNVDQKLPGAQLCARAFHDVLAHHPGDRVAAGGFAMALLSKLPGEGDILWCQLLGDGREYGALYGPGLRWLGIDPGRIIHVQVRCARDLAWVMEEAVRSGSVAAVISEGPALDFTTTRRLSLACKEAAIPCLYVNLSGEMRPSAADTRWRITATAGPDTGHEMLDQSLGPVTAAWSVSLVKCRGGRLGKWQLYWDYETVSFHMATALCDGKVSEPAAPTTSKVVAFQRAG